MAGLRGRNQASQSSLEQALADRAMTKNNELRYGAPGVTAVHLCIDMQRMFVKRPSGRCRGLSIIRALGGPSTHAPLAGTIAQPVFLTPHRNKLALKESSSRGIVPREMEDRKRCFVS